MATLMRRKGEALTIAACFVTGEGVVLGADSTVTVSRPRGTRYYDHAQKLFHVGGEHLGIVNWGDVPISVSYRTMVATFGDDLARHPATSVHDAAERWARHCVGRLRREYAPQIALAESGRANALAGHAPTSEESAIAMVKDFSAGFCIGGWAPPDRTPVACEVRISLEGSPRVEDIGMGVLQFWGAPNIFRRVLHGIDWGSLDDILEAEHPDGSRMWTGTEEELYDRVFARALRVSPGLPIREAVDLVHFSIQTTIKALKFSDFEPTCGGPIEVATITSDRSFRWVRHKDFDAAI